MISDRVRGFLEANVVGVLATHRSDGDVRQSVVYYALDGDRLLISSESRRGKSRDIARSGRASLCVVGLAAPYPSLTVEGPALLRSEKISADTAKVWARITGQEITDPPSEESLTAVDRIIIEITIDRVYGVSYLEDH